MDQHPFFNFDFNAAHDKVRYLGNAIQSLEDKVNEYKNIDEDVTGKEVQEMIGWILFYKGLVENYIKELDQEFRKED